MTKAEEKAIDRAWRGLDRAGQTIADDGCVLDWHTRRVLEEAVAGSGVAPRARPYLIRRLRYHLDRGPVPSPPTDLGGDAAWIRRRAWELVDANRGRITPVNDRTEPRS